MIKAVIFDLDGTLLNTIDDLNNSVNDTYKYYGIKKRNTTSETMALVGHGMKNLIIKCFPNKDESFIDEALEKFLSFYDTQYYKETKPYEGMVDLVNKLIEKGIKVGVNSNKNDNYTKHLIELNFPRMNLEYVRGIKKGDNIKPDPTNVNEVISKMGLNEDEILYVGDSQTDYKTAKNAEVKFVAVTWGFRTKSELEKEGTKHFINKPNELLDFI